MDALRDLFDHLDRRGGIAPLADVARLGLTPGAARQYWRRRGWQMPYPNVLASPGVDMTFERRALAAADWVGEPVVVTGVAALYLRGLADRPPSQMALVVPERRRNRRRPGVVVHRSDIAIARPMSVLGHTPVATAAWAVRDRARFGGPGGVRTHVIRVLQRNGATLDELVEAASVSPTAPGMPELLEVLEELRRDRVDSGVELDARRLLRSHGFEPWPAPFPARCPDGKVVHLDVPFPAAWFALECDDPSTHDGRSFATDRTRWSQATRAGWRIGFVWRERLRDDPVGVVEEVADALANADPDRPPPLPAHGSCRRCRAA